jgi:uncharacterized protein YqfA (UPF0365 family)
MNVDPVVLAVVIACGLVFVAVMAGLFSVLRPWVMAHLANVNISMLDIVRMKLCRIPPTLIIHAAITLKHKNIEVSVTELEACYLGSRGEVKNAMELATLVVKKRADAAT